MPPRRRRKALIWTLPVVLVLVLAGGGVTFGLWWKDRAAATRAATADAKALVSAAATARKSEAGFSSAAGEAEDYLEKVAEPAKKTIAAHADDFGTKVAKALAAAADEAGSRTTPPFPSKKHAATPHAGVVTGAPSNWAELLTDRYRAVRGSDRVDARDRVRAETRRLRSVAEKFDSAAGDLRSGLDGVDEAIVKAAAAGVAHGKKVAKDSGYADAKTKDGLTKALATLDRLAGTTLPIEWAVHAEAESSPLAGFPKAASSVASAEKATKESDAANTPAPPPSSSGGDGGSEGGDGTMWCTRWVPSVWGPGDMVYMPC